MPLQGDGSHVCTACRRGLRHDDKVCPTCGGRNIVPNDGGTIKLFGGTTFAGPAPVLNDVPTRPTVARGGCGCSYCNEHPGRENDPSIHHDAMDHVDGGAHGDGHPDVYSFDPNRDVHHFDSPHADAHTDIPPGYGGKQEAAYHGDTSHGDTSMTGRDAHAKGLKNRDEIVKALRNADLQRAVASAIQGAVLPRMRGMLDRHFVYGQDKDRIRQIGHGDEVEFVMPLSNVDVHRLRSHVDGLLKDALDKKGPSLPVQGWDFGAPGGDKAVVQIEGQVHELEDVRNLSWGARLLRALQKGSMSIATMLTGRDITVDSVRVEQQFDGVTFVTLRLMTTYPRRK